MKKLMKALEFRKAKYLKRTGSPGHYKYIYGKISEGKKKTSEANIKFFEEHGIPVSKVEREKKKKKTMKDAVASRGPRDKESIDVQARRDSEERAHMMEERRAKKKGKGSTGTKTVAQISMERMRSKLQSSSPESDVSKWSESEVKKRYRKDFDERKTMKDAAAARGKKKEESKKPVRGIFEDEKRIMNAVIKVAPSAQVEGGSDDEMNIDPQTEVYEDMKYLNTSLRKIGYKAKLEDDDTISITRKK